MKRSSILFILFIFCLTSRAQDVQEVTLEQVVALALQENYDVLLASNSLDALAKENRNSIGLFLPTFNANGALVWNRNNQELEFEDANRNNSGKAQARNLTTSLQMNWVLFDGMKMFITQNRLQTMTDQGMLTMRSEMTNTIALVIKTYYDVVRQKQQLKAIQEQMMVNEERVKLADRRLQVGIAGKPELLQAKVDYNAMRTQVFQQEALIKKLKEQLNVLVASALPAQYDVSDTIMIDLNLKKDQFTNIEHSNYALRSSKYNVEVAELQKKEREAAKLPVLSFNSAYNYNTVNNQKLINPFMSLFSRTNGLNYGLTATWGIFNNYSVANQVQLARINIKRQELLYDQQYKTVSMEVKNALVDYENAKKILLIEEENIVFAKENVFIALEGFKRNVTTFIELRTAQQSLADAYNRLINARYLAKVAETELMRLNGQLLRDAE